MSCLTARPDSALKFHHLVECPLLYPDISLSRELGLLMWVILVYLAFSLCVKSKLAPCGDWLLVYPLSSPECTKYQVEISQYSISPLTMGTITSMSHSCQVEHQRTRCVMNGVAELEFPQLRVMALDLKVHKHQ